MKIRHLIFLVAVLSCGVALALTNPSLESYVAFVEAELNKALDRTEPAERSKERAMLRTIFRAHSHELVLSVIHPHTIRHNWGLFSRFETTAMDVHIEVLGIGGHFIPLRGIDEAIIRLGRLAF